MIVDWKVGGILGPDNQELDNESLKPQPGHRAIDWHTAGFHTVIGRFFEPPEAAARQPGVTIVLYRNLPMSTGHFWARNFHRFYNDALVNRYPLPYKGVAQQHSSSAAHASGSSAGHAGSSSAGHASSSSARHAGSSSAGHGASWSTGHGSVGRRGH